MADTHLPSVVDTPEPSVLTPPSTHADAGRREWGQHPINIRMSLPLLIGRYYITVVAGKERRRAARRASERQQHPLDTAANSMVFFLTGFVAALAVLGGMMLIMAHGFGWSFVVAG